MITKLFCTLLLSSPELWLLRLPLKLQCVNIVGLSILYIVLTLLKLLIMDKKKIFEIIKIVVTAIISIATVLLVESCTMSMSISKYNTNSKQSTEQTSTSSVDSTYINFKN